MARQKRLNPIGIGKKVRESHPWIDEVTKKAYDLAIKELMRKWRRRGPELAPQRLVRLADKLEKIQRTLNRLERRHEVISKALLAHWGHTGAREIESMLGKTLLSTSAKYSINQDGFKKRLPVGTWQNLSERVLAVALLAEQGENDAGLRKIARRFMRVKPTVNVTPPSSRRPKSGRADYDEDKE